MSNEKTRRKKSIPLLSALILLLNLMMAEYCLAMVKNYKITVNTDGGYTLEIDTEKTDIFSADGFLHKEKLHYVIKLIGNGENWSYRSQKGYFYSEHEILSNNRYWDIGYAWVDIERKYIYLNLYWVRYPDGMSSSDVNGKYEIVKD